MRFRSGSSVVKVQVTNPSKVHIYNTKSAQVLFMSMRRSDFLAC